MHDVRQVGTDVLQHHAERLEDALGLCRDIGAHQLAGGRIERGRAANGDQRADARDVAVGAYRRRRAGGVSVSTVGMASRIVTGPVTVTTAQLQKLQRGSADDDQRLPRQLHTLLAHVVAAQLAQRVGRRARATSSCARPARSRCCPSAWRPVARRRPLSAITSSVSALADERSLRPSARPAAATRRRRARCARPRPCRRAASLRGGGHRQHREVERAAPAQLPVRAAPAVGSAGTSIDVEDLVGPPRQVVRCRRSRRDRRRRPSARRAADTSVHARAERLQHRRGVGRRHRQALRARRRDPADARRPSSCRSRSPCATRSSGRSRCSACRGTGCRRSCPCCAGAASRPARRPATARRMPARMRGRRARARSASTPAPMRAAVAVRSSRAKLARRRAGRRASRGVCWRRFMFGQQVGAAGDQHRVGRRLRRASPRLPSTRARRAVAEAAAAAS